MPAELLAAATSALAREHARLRDRWVQDLGNRVRQLHRLVDLGFPELTKHVKDLGSAMATTLLTRCPTAMAFQPAMHAGVCFVSNLPSLHLASRHVSLRGRCSPDTPASLVGHVENGLKLPVVRQHLRGGATAHWLVELLRGQVQRQREPQVRQ